MKDITLYINEALKIKSGNKVTGKYKPKNKEELKNIIIQTVEREVKKDNKVINLNIIDTSEIEDFNELFVDIDRYLPNYGYELKIDEWNTSKVKSMSGLFDGCRKVEKVDISNWDVSKCVSFSKLFSCCGNMKYIGKLDNWNMKEAKYIGSMFMATSELEEIGDLSNWNTENVKELDFFISGNKKIKSIGSVDNWSMDSIEYNYEAFSCCANLELDLSELIRKMQIANPSIFDIETMYRKSPKITI